MSNNSEAAFLSKLQTHPTLRKRFEEILDVAENTSGDIITADEAEARAIEEVRKLGSELMHAWAISEHTKQCQSLSSKGVKQTKKNSTGTQPLAL